MGLPCSFANSRCRTTTSSPFATPTRCPTLGLQAGIRSAKSRIEAVVDYHDFGLARYRLAMF
jgi:hypothetical protein